MAINTTPQTPWPLGHGFHDQTTAVSEYHSSKILNHDQRAVMSRKVTWTTHLVLSACTIR